MQDDIKNIYVLLENIDKKLDNLNVFFNKIDQMNTSLQNIQQHLGIVHNQNKTPIQWDEQPTNIPENFFAKLNKKI